MFTLMFATLIASSITEYNAISPDTDPDDASISTRHQAKVRAYKDVVRDLNSVLKTATPDTRAELHLALAQAHEEMGHFVVHSSLPEQLNMEQRSIYRAEVMERFANPSCVRARHAYQRALELSPGHPEATAGLQRMSAASPPSAAEVKTQVDEWIASGPLFPLGGNVYGRPRSAPGPGLDRLVHAYASPDTQACLSAIDF